MNMQTNIFSLLSEAALLLIIQELYLVLLVLFYVWRDVVNLKGEYAIYIICLLKHDKLLHFEDVLDF